MLYPEFIDLLEGDHLAALMLSRIYYWHEKPDGKGKSRLRVFKNGRGWLVKSHVDWETELRMTRKQSRRCLELLRDRGLIKTELHKFNNTPMLHILYTGQLAPKGHSTGPTGPINCAPEGQSSGPQGPIFITVNTTVSTSVNTTQLASEVASIQSIPEDQQQQEQQMDANDILKAFKEKQVVQQGTGINAAALLWKKRTSLEGQWSKPLTGKEVGQLKHAMNAMGAHSVKVMDHVLQHWQVFANEVHLQKGITPAMSPDCGFFCKYSDVAMNLWVKHTNKAEQKPVIAPVLPKAKASVPEVVDNPVHEDIATPEQVQAALAAFGVPGAAKS